jgi:hypothetical protein
MNEDCRLYGLECLEKTCTACEQKPSKLVWTLILCEPRGIYMGLCEWPSLELPKAIKVYSCRSCVYYVKTGSAGLATMGPQKGSRVTGAQEEVMLANPKSLHAVTQEALSCWEDEPWAG